MTIASSTKSQQNAKLFVQGKKYCGENRRHIFR